MRNVFSFFLLGAILSGCGVVSAQTQTTQPTQPASVDLQVQLASSIKAKKAKVGDVVTALTVAPTMLSQGLVVPAEAKVTGHVRQVEADSADAHTSSIAITFDEIALKNGQKLPLNCFVRAALMPAPQGPTAPQGQADPMMAPNRGAGNGGMGGYLSVGSSGGMLAGTPVASGDPSKTSSTQPQGSANPVVAHKGQVIGMPGVELFLTNPDHLSLFKSAHKNLELGEGMQMMLEVKTANQ